MSTGSLADPLLAEQVAYYRAVAPEYESLNVPGGGGGEVAAALEAFAPAGEVLELACGTVERRIGAGAAYRIVKVPYRPAELERRLDELGWRLPVTQTSGTFYWGAGSRLRRG